MIKWPWPISWASLLPDPKLFPSAGDQQLSVFLSPHQLSGLRAQISTTQLHPSDKQTNPLQIPSWFVTTLTCRDPTRTNTLHPCDRPSVWPLTSWPAVVCLFADIDFRDLWADDLILQSPLNGKKSAKLSHYIVNKFGLSFWSLFTTCYVCKCNRKDFKLAKSSESLSKRTQDSSRVLCCLLK